jgi:hypothetical protein
MLRLGRIKLHCYECAQHSCPHISTTISDPIFEFPVNINVTNVLVPISEVHLLYSQTSELAIGIG